MKQHLGLSLIMVTTIHAGNVPSGWVGPADEQAAVVVAQPQQDMRDHFSRLTE